MITIRKNSVTGYTYTFHTEKGYFRPTKEQLEQWEKLINLSENELKPIWEFVEWERNSHENI
jgi:hypothetical protein